MRTLLAAVLVVLASSPAHADDVWTSPYPGIRHLHRVTGTQDYHVMQVDLGDPSIHVVATRPSERFHTVSWYAEHVGAAVAINANFFATSTCGLAFGDGEAWLDAYEDGCDDTIAFGDGRVTAFDSTGARIGPLPDGFRNAVSGQPWLVQGGAASPLVEPPHMFTPNPRTAIGFSADGRSLVLLVVDGRRSDAQGMTGPELADVMLSFDVSEAVNLDGGGSSELFVTNEGGVVNHPSDGMERVVANQLGIIVSLPPPAVSPGDAGDGASGSDARGESDSAAVASDAGPLDDLGDGGAGARATGCNCHAVRGGEPFRGPWLVALMLAGAITSRRPARVLRKRRA